MNESTPDFLTVSQAAAALGISARAVQKRCASGTLAARRVATNSGDRWEVEGANLPANLDASRTRTREPLGRVQDANTREPSEDSHGKAANLGRVQDANLGRVQDANLDANPRTIGREQDASYVALEVELLRDALRREREATAREREIADQWRAQVEAANRQASEATAALREHLKLSAKALPSPDETSAHNAPQSAQTSETGKEARPLASAAQSGTRREARPLWKVLLGVR